MAKVLVVDDSPTEMFKIVSLLEKNGHTVIKAENGEDSITISKAEQPDIILMDVVMPGLNGFQATRQITKAAETAHIPVIIITTKDQDTDRLWGMRQGAKEYLTKPVEEKQLLDILSKFLG
jgi:twitching motility two-component system response regulator PilH